MKGKNWNWLLLTINTPVLGLGFGLVSAPYKNFWYICARLAVISRSDWPICRCWQEYRQNCSRQRVTQCSRRRTVLFDVDIVVTSIFVADSLRFALWPLWRQISFSINYRLRLTTVNLSNILGRECIREVTWNTCSLHSLLLLNCNFLQPLIYIITRTDTHALLLKKKQTNKQIIIKNIIRNSGIVVNLRPGRRELRDNLRNKRKQNKEVVKRTRLKAGKRWHRLPGQTLRWVWKAKVQTYAACNL